MGFHPMWCYIETTHYNELFPYPLFMKYFAVLLTLAFSKLVCAQNAMDLNSLNSEISKTKPQEVLNVFSRYKTDNWDTIELETLEIVSYSAAVMADFELTKDIFAHLKSRSDNDLNSVLWGKMNFNFGFACFKTGLYHQALEYYIEALNIFQSHSDEIQVARTKGVIALLENYAGDPQTALNTFEEIIDFYQRKQEWQKLTTALHNKAVALIKLERFEEATTLLFSVHKMSIEHGRENLQSYIHKNLGIAMLGNGSYDEADFHLKKALKLASAIPLSHEISQINMELAKLELLKGNADTATTLLNTAYSIAITHHFAMTLIDIYQMQSQIAEKQSNYKKAFTTLASANRLRAEMAGTKLSNQLTALNTYFATLNSEHERALLEKQNTIMQLQIENASQERLVYIVVSLLLLLILGIIAMLLYRTRQKEQLYRMQSRIDSLTELPNRTAFFERVQEKIEMKQKTISFAIADIDKFKEINDSYGHDCGDHVLKVVANRLRAEANPDILQSRWGGEEFAFAFIGTNLEGAVAWLESVRKNCSQNPIQYCNKALTVTMTAGVSQLTEAQTIEDAIKTADELMYIGKQSGRNRISWR